MTKPGNSQYTGLPREYDRGRKAGFVLTIIFPLCAAIAMILLLPGSAQIELEGGALLIISVFVFSLMITFMARLVLQRMAAHIRRRLYYDRYRPNLLFYALVVFYLLLMCPAVWGIISYVLVRNLVALLMLCGISAMAWFLLTPRYEDLLSPR